MAASDARVSALLLQMRHSQQDAKRIQRDLQDIRRDMRGVGTEAKAMGAATAPMDKLTGAIRNQEKGVRTLSKSATDAAREFDLLRASIKGAADVDVSGVAGKGQQLTGGRSSRLAVLGREARTLLPAIPIPGTGFSSEFLTKLLQILGTLPPAVLPVVGALGIVTAGFIALKASLDPIKNTIGIAVNSVEAYYNAIAEGTTTDKARAQVNSLNQTLAAQREELALLEKAYNDTVQAERDFGEGANAFQAAATAFGTLDDVTARMNELRETIDSNQGEAEGLTRAIAEDALARNDAAAATKAATEAEIELLNARLQAVLRGGQTIAANEQTRQQILAASSEEELDRLRAGFEQRKLIIDAELDFLEAQYQDLRNSPLIQDALAKLDEVRSSGKPITTELQEELDAILAPLHQLEARMLQLGQQSSELQGNMIPLIDSLYESVIAAEIAKEKEDELIAAREEAAAALDKTRADIAKTSAEITALTAANAAKIKEIADALNEKLSEAERDRNEAIGEAEADAAESRNEAAQEANEDRERIEEDHQKNLAKIMREFERDSEQAAQDRNVVAFDQAERARDDALADEAESYDDSRKQVNAQLKKTNAEIDKRLVEQRNTAIKRYNEQVAAAYAAANKQRQIEIAKYNAELQAKQQHLTMLQAQETAYRAAALGLQKNFLDAMLQLASNAIGKLNAASLGSGKPNVPPGGGQGPIVPPKLDVGGTVLRTGAAIVHRGELVIPPSRNGGGSGININISGMGLNRRQLHDAIDKKLDAFERGMVGDAA